MGDTYVNLEDAVHAAHERFVELREGDVVLGGHLDAAVGVLRDMLKEIDAALSRVPADGHADLDAALYMVDSLKRELAVKRGEAGALWEGRSDQEAEMEALRAAPCSVKELDDGALWVEGRVENILTALAALWDAAPSERQDDVEAAASPPEDERPEGPKDDRPLTTGNMPPGMSLDGGWNPAEATRQALRPADGEQPLRIDVDVNKQPPISLAGERPPEFPQAASQEQGGEDGWVHAS